MRCVQKALRCTEASAVKYLERIISRLLLVIVQLQIY